MDPVPATQPTTPMPVPAEKPAHSPSPSIPKSEHSQPQKTALDAAAVALAVQVLQQLRVGLSQALLYTLETRQYEKAVEGVYATINAMLEKIGAFSVSINKTEPLFNGMRVEIPSAMRQITEYIEKTMNATGLSSIKFAPGLTAAELGPFLQLLARKKLTSTDGAKVNQFLREQGIEHIQTDELRYVAIGAQERVVSGALKGMANHSMAQTAIDEVTDAFHDAVKKVEDTEAREQIRAEMTDQLIQKDASMLGNILLTASQRLKDPANAELCNLVALPQRDADLLNQTLALAKLLAESGALNSEDCKKAVADLAARLAEPYRTRAEDILGKINLDPAALPVVPEWLASAHTALKGGSATDRLEGILTQSPHALLDEKMFTQIVDVLDEFSVAGMDAEAQRLMAHVAGALHSITKADRMKAVERMSFLLDRSMEQVSEAVRGLENALLEACTHETCDEVMRLLLNHLSKRCVHHYNLGNFERAGEHLDWITSLEESSRLAMRDEGANVARRAREEMGMTDFAETLARDLTAPDLQGKTAARMAGQLGKNVWVAVIQRLRSEQDPAVQAALAGHLKNFGAEAVQMFFAVLSRDNDPAAAQQLLTLASLVADEAALWSHVPALLRNADGKIREQALNFVLRNDSEIAVNTLVNTLHAETGAEQRAALLEALSKLRHASAARALVAELESARSASPLDEELLISLLYSLSGHDGGEVVPALARLLTPARGRTMMLGANESVITVSKPVATTAIKVLARYYTDPAAAEVLERCRKDKDPDISRLALVSLRGIVAAGQQHVEETQAVPIEPAPSPAQPAAKTPPPAPGLRKTRRFEALEGQAQVDEIFRAGAAIGAAPASGSPVTPRPPTPQPFQPPSVPASGSGFLRSAGSGRQAKSSGVNPAPPRSHQSLAGMKPVLEGQLKDLGLATTLNMMSSRDGVLRVDAGGGAEGRVYVKNKKVACATVGGKAGIEALVDLDALKAATFQYFAKVMPPDFSMDLPVADVQKKIEAYRTDKDDKNFF